MDKRRQASYLLEPPAGEVVRELLDEIDELVDIAEQIYALLTKETDESNRLYNRLNKIRAKHR